MNKKLKKDIKNIINYGIPAILMVFMAFANAGLVYIFAVVHFLSDFNLLAYFTFILSIVNVMVFVIFYAGYIGKVEDE